MENSEKPKRCGWSIVRKAQVIGALVGGLFTIGAAFYCALIPPEHLFDFSDSLLFLITAPIFLLVSRDAGGPMVVFECFAVIVNSFLCFLAGTFIGWLIQKFKTNN